MSENDFDTLQKKNYQGSLNKGLPVSKQIDGSTIAAALGISPFFEPTISPESITSTFAMDSPAIARDEACRSLRSPTLGMRPADARVGCGWWYASDPKTQSTGAYGTRRAPMNPNLTATVGRGRWIWDAREAIREEGIKQSKKLLSCADLQYSTYPNMGWCTDGNGKGVLANADNTSMFSEQYCSTPVITDPTKCPKATTSTADITTVCSPQNGALQPACLQMLANQSCSPKGALSVALQNGYAGKNTNVTYMNNILQEYQFTVPNGILVDGRLSTDTATSAFQQLSRIATNPVQDRKQNAAAGLCTDASVFNVCRGFGPNDVGSTATKPASGYPPTCVTSAANAMGWTSGSYMPVNGGMTYWNTIGTWGAVLAEMKRIYNQAIQSSGSTLSQGQVTAMKQVFGVDVVPPQHDCETRILHYVGCYRDTWARAIPNQRNNVYNNPVKECSDMAKQHGDNVFGLQDGAQCFTGKDSPYSRYGQVPENSCGPVGNAWKQQVFTIGTKITKPTFYTQYNFQGTGVALDRGRYPFSLFLTFLGNDTVRSIRIPAGYSVTIYQDDIGSPSTTLTSDASDLRSVRYASGRTAENSISALVIA